MIARSRVLTIRVPVEYFSRAMARDRLDHVRHRRIPDLELSAIQPPLYGRSSRPVMSPLSMTAGMAKSNGQSGLPDDGHLRWLFRAWQDLAGIAIRWHNMATRRLLARLERKRKEQSMAPHTSETRSPPRIEYLKVQKLPGTA
jgi:hypothetical protein